MRTVEEEDNMTGPDFRAFREYAEAVNAVAVRPLDD